MINSEITTNDCKEVIKISKFIHKWILEQPKVGEESLTDYILFQLSEKVPRIQYKAFNRHQEAKITGADWEWWFLLSDDCAYKLRVQAKKCHLDNYPNIAYSNKYGLQIEKLLEDALNENSIPFYAFYTNEAENGMFSREIDDEGIYMAGANKVYNLSIQRTRRKISIQSVLSISKPLSFFFCFLLGEIKYNNSFDFFEEYYNEERRENIQKSLNIKNESLKDTLPPLGLQKSIPPYVLSLIEEKEDIDVWYEDEFRKEIKDINAIMVYDLRKE